MPAPATAIDHALPIAAALPALDRALAAHACAVVQAPPGAGKSTALPLHLLDAPWLQGRRILMLEPRRLAARGVASWMAHTLEEQVGATVGYRIRMETRVSRNTRIEVVTEGILTRMLQDDPALEPVGAVLFDEFHERSLHADLGLALCLDAQAQLRPDLRIVPMSATLDGEALARFLGDAPLVVAHGRSFPVEVRHAQQAPGADLAAEVARTAGRALRETDGDILVFLPGAAEIRRCGAALDALGLPDAVEVLPLYGELGFAAQERAIAPSPAGRRKIVLATSIAETSLTIEGVRAVIDAGLSRRARFDPRTGMTRLATTRVSRAAAEQRRGRAGRVAPGICYRLWTVEGERTLEEFAPPEILEADLAPLTLELAAWGIDDPSALRWLNAPPAAAYAQARELLAALGAIDRGGRITAHGRAMNLMGTHPRLAHMLAAAPRWGRYEEASAIAALIEERDILRLAPGTRAADLRLRLDALQGNRAELPPQASIDRPLADRVRRLARGYAREGAGRAREEPAVPDGDAAGLLLALAYPDRIAQRRGEGGGRFVLANGRGAVLDERDPLAHAEFIVAADLDAGERDARIWLAAPIARATLERCLADAIESRETVAWDPRAGAVIARRERRLGRLSIAEQALERADPVRIAAAMLAGIRALGIGALPWDAHTRQWQARVEFARRLDTGAKGRPLPAVADADLLATIEDWLAPWLGGISRREDLRRIDLPAALAGLLDHEQRRRLELLAPTHLSVPSGSRIALDYSRGEVPVLAARLQELFGLAQSPCVGAGRVPVLVEILSPARRPVQVTRDLASFWARGYQDVRKDLRGRYPRHYWPEDPYTAVATRKVRPPPG
ncbi:MAG: ATP-dependent helicase HrpB [Gammaproteobacteria bacterium]